MNLSRAVACKPVYMCIYKYMYIYIYLYIYKYIYVYKYRYIYIYIMCIYICIYIILCIYTYIYISYLTKMVGLVQKWAPQNRLPLVGNFHGQSSDSPCAVALLPGHWHRCQAGLTWFWYIDGNSIDLYRCKLMIEDGDGYRWILI